MATWLEIGRVGVCTMVKGAELAGEDLMLARGPISRQPRSVLHVKSEDTPGLTEPDLGTALGTLTREASVAPRHETDMQKCARSSTLSL